MDYTEYSKLSESELTAQHNMLSAKYGDYIHNKKMKLSDLLPKSMSKKEREKEINFVCGIVCEVLRRRLEVKALVDFNFMNETGNFCGMDENSVLCSLVRCIEKIPRFITEWDVDRLYTKCELVKKELNLKTKNEYNDWFKKFSINLLGVEYPASNFYDINSILELIGGAQYYLYATFIADFQVRFIYGKIEKLKRGDHIIYYFTNELVRSPHYPLSIAAELHAGKITIARKESVSVIYLNKWESYFYKTKDEFIHDSKNPNTAIKNGLAALVLEKYNVKNIRELDKISRKFKEDILISIFNHETGHQNSKDFISPEQYAFLHSLNDGDTLVNIVYEAMAEFAPKVGEKHGAISYLIETAKTDIDRATGMFFSGISDNYHDDIQPRMPKFTDALVSPSLKFINKDKTVDFIKMENEREKIFILFTNAFTAICKRIISIIKNSKFVLEKFRLIYSEMKDHIFYMYLDSSNAVGFDAMEDFQFFWINMMGYLQKYSEEGWRQYQIAMEEEHKKLEASILDFVTEGNKEKYSSLREYIIDRCRETGIYE